MRDGIGNGGVSEGRDDGEQGDIQRLRHMPWACVVADEQLAMGEEPHQFPYRAGLNMVKHAGLQRCWQQRLQAAVVLLFPRSAVDQDLGIVLLDQPARHLGEAVDGPALVVTEGVDPHGDEWPGRVDASGQQGLAPPLSLPVAEPEVVVAIFAGQLERLEQ